jgi:hypothetical protein
MSSETVNFTYTFVVGDWSGDGHDKTEKYTVKTSHPLNTIIEAVTTQIRLTCPELLTEPSSTNAFPLNLCHNYEDSTVSVDVVERLGVSTCEYDVDDNGVWFRPETWLMFMFDVAKVQLPDLVWEDVTFPTVMIGGYGLFF